MIISPKYKFIFLATEKTGCTSVSNALENINDTKKIIGNLVPIYNYNYLYSKHTSFSEFKNNYSDFNDYFKFAFVRNPWDRVVSWYNFSKKIKNPDSHRNITGKNFLSYIKEYEIIWANKQQTQSDFTKCCDFVGRYENLQNDFNIICDKIGIPQQQLPHKNATNHKHYTEYYDDETKQIVAKKYAKDIEYFGYKFDG